MTHKNCKCEGECLKPNRGSTYYYFNAAGLSDISCWFDDNTDNKRLIFGNHFKTLEKAEQARDKVKALLLGLK